MGKVQYIDIHAHAYRRPVPFVTQFCTPDELLQRYDAAGIEMGAILPIVSPEIYFPQPNEDILDMVADRPDRFFAFCNIDPRVLTNRADAPLDRVMRYYQERGCRGIGEIMLNCRMDDPLVQNLFRHAEAVGLPVTTDGSDKVGGDFGLYDDPGLPLLEHTLQCFPKLAMIGHGPVFWAEITALERPALRKTAFAPDGTQVGWNPPAGKIQCEGVIQQLFRLYPNLYGELSDAYVQLVRDEDYAVRFMIEFQDRLFFGTDICSFGHSFALKEFLDKLHDSGKLPETVWRKIVRDNAIKFFRLPLATEADHV